MTDDEFKALLADQDVDLAPRLRHMIDHMAKRIEYAEGRRNFFLTASGGALAAGLTSVGIVSSRPFWLPLEFAFWVLGVGLITFALVVWKVHSNHVNFPYPFTQVAQVPKWFYHYAIPDWTKYTFPWIRQLSKGEITQDKNKFGNDYVVFLDASKDTLLDPTLTRLQDVKQVYLLHVNEMYKNQFLTSLRKTFSCGLMLVLAGAALAFVAGIFVNHQRWPGEDAREQSGLKIHSIWEPTSPTASSTANLNVLVTNSTGAELTLSALQLRNHRGILLPYNVIQGKLDFPIRIEPGAEIKLVLTIELRANSITTIESIVLVRSP